MQVDDDASGPSSSASSIAARPSSAVPTTASWGCRSISGESASRKGWSSSARRTRIVPPASASCMGPQVSLVRHVFATTSPQSLGDRGCTRPWAGPPGSGHGPVGDSPPMRVWMRASTSSGTSTWIAETSRRLVAEATAAGDEQARFLPQIKDTSRRIATLVARAAQEDPCRSCSVGTTRWPLAPWRGHPVPAPGPDPPGAEGHRVARDGHRSLRARPWRRAPRSAREVSLIWGRTSACSSPAAVASATAIVEAFPRSGAYSVPEHGWTP